ncbi:M1 family aminopeptidase [Nocardioides litoris]|uniref:M1 family aminopeptidase n=1 Tax=Nocardioides litoris TaxID=1926648 RepID=UPI00111DD07A|nr:M1 family aminopeptidase [Nocardioides litoris]
MPLPRSLRPTRSRLAVALVPAVAAAALALPQAAPASAEETVAGAQTSGDALFPNVGNGGYDVQHYDLDLAWTPATDLARSTIEATAAIRARTTGAPLSSYSLDLEGPELTVENVTVDGVAATWTRDEQPDLIRHKLVVTPATAVSGEFTTVVTYAGVPTKHTDADGSAEGWNATNDGATFLNQPVGAMTGFPSNNTPADKATYTIDIDIPSTITNAAGTGASAAASNGELVDKDVDAAAGRTTWRWRQTRPMATELVLISIGKYDVAQGEVTLSDGSTIPEWTFVDSALTPADKLLIANRRDAQGPITRGLESVFGPYPGGSTGAVIDVVTGLGINYALETQDRSFFPSTATFLGDTLTHEITHQWYGNHVSPRVWNDIWINEGMATWAPGHYNNVIAGTSTTSNHARYYSSWNSGTAAQYRTPPGNMPDSAVLYGYQTYTRSAQLWEALKLSIGDPAFFRFVKQWQTTYAGQSRGLADFEALAESVSGRDLGAFFQDWVLDPDKPAWPQRYDVKLASQPVSGTVAPGSAVTYTLTATNMGRVALSPAGGPASVATVDLADVLDDATIDAAALPAGVTLDGTTLVWTVPTLAAGTFVTGASAPTLPTSTSVSFPVTVKPTASAASLRATAGSRTLGGFCSPAGCTSTVGVTAQPLPSADPTITGTPAVGQTLTAVTDGWAEGTTFAYQWSVAGAAVEGANASTFVPRAADVDKTVTVAVTGTHPRYTDVTRTSAPTAPVALGTQQAGTPSVAGTPAVGRPLTARPGTWTPGTAFTYQWSVAGTAVEGATAGTFTPRPADLGKTVTVTLTGTQDGYAAASATSEPSSPVLRGTLVAPTPTLAGTPQVGRPLAARPGAWTEGATLTYQWRRGGRPIAGATAASYTPGAADLGAVLQVVVTGSKDGYTTVSRTSAVTDPVAPGRQTLRPAPRIAGKPVVGRTLRAVPGRRDPGVALTYRWYVAGQAVPGARGSRSTFVPRRADRGDRVRLVVTATKPGYATVTGRSAPTARVR